MGLMLLLLMDGWEGISSLVPLLMGMIEEG
jgi:hypothetical protein